MQAAERRDAATATGRGRCRGDRRASLAGSASLRCTCLQALVLFVHARVDYELHGQMCYRYRENEDMEYYDGDWKDGLRHGKGTLKFQDGGYYKGDFDMERMHGRGLFVWPDGSQYEGQWKKNVRHGEGTYLSASGTIYRGRFWKNMRHGPGVLTYLNGNSYEGVWELDNIKGMGRYTLLAGSEMDEAEKVHLKVFGY